MRQNKKHKMVLGMLSAFYIILFSGGTAGMNLYGAQDIYNFSALDINGNEVNFSKYRGKTLLIVNTASKCGFTSQYGSLQTLYETYKDQGFEVLGFPSNDFGKQEPGTDEEIKQFCDLRFKVRFPLFSKIHVKGKDKHPLYQYLTEQTDHKGSIKWNFTKFLVGPDGQVVARYSSMKDPLNKDVTQAIEKLLKG